MGKRWRSAAESGKKKRESLDARASMEGEAGENRSINKGGNCLEKTEKKEKKGGVVIGHGK